MFYLVKPRLYGKIIQEMQETVVKGTRNDKESCIDWLYRPAGQSTLEYWKGTNYFILPSKTTIFMCIIW